jgi:Raf kinase inhibitor-like YbhB/YbcL family protein
MLRTTRDALLASCLLVLVPACGSDDAPEGGSEAPDAGAPQPTNDAGARDATSPIADAAATDDATANDATANDAQAAFTLTSTAITPGAPIASAYTCAGTNLSPPLAWAGAPSGAKSFAMVLTDLTNKTVHWVLWDIPIATTSLPENVPLQATLTSPAGAKQSTSYDGTTHGYLGPCPNGNVHTYQFAIHAIDVATLPGVTTSTARNTVRDAILQHDIGAPATLSGTSDAKKK